MREGERAGEVFVILDGWTKVSLDEQGQERVMAERGPGDLVGERGTVPGTCVPPPSSRSIRSGRWS
jgi:CRP-like cAMP-binding protein